MTELLGVPPPNVIAVPPKVRLNVTCEVDTIALI